MPLDVKALEEELHRDPNSRKFSELAREYQRVGRLEEALALCEKGLQKHPSQSQGRLIQAQIYLGQGRLEDAKGAVEKILLAQPDHVAANHLAADIFATQGDLPRAMRHYQVVDLFDPGRADIGARIREINGRLVEAAVESDLEKSLKSAPAAAVVSAPLELNPPEEGTAAQPLLGMDAATGAAPTETGSETPSKIIEESESFVTGANEHDELFGGTIRMPQVQPEADRSAEEDSPGVDAQFSHKAELAPPRDEVFSELLSGENGDPLGSDLLDVHEQTLLSLPKMPPEEAPEVAKAESISSLRRPSVPMPSPRSAHAGEVVSENRVEVSPEVATSLSTTTLAELYAQQGFPEKAVEIYQRVLLQDPDQPDIKRKIQDLKLRISGEAPELPEVHQEDVRRAVRQRRIQVLEGWLRRVKEEQHV